MEQNHKHMCKFCYKSFPCGRSLGGHMRSHLINISSTEKKLPPLTNAKNNHRTDVLAEDGTQFGYGLRENPKKTKKISNKIDEDTLLEEKLCKQCGKSFQSWKALFGHMKCHSVTAKVANSVDEDSWMSSSDHQKAIMSDSEAATPLCRRKRSDRAKRYTTITNSSSLSVANFSPCVSELDQQEEEEVALSLILLSMDVGNLGCMSSVVESSGISSEFLEANKTAKMLVSDVKVSRGECLKFKKLKNGKLESEFRTPDVPRKRLRKVSADDELRADVEFDCKNLDIGGNECEVNSPKTLIKKNGLEQFGSDCKKKSKCIDSHDFAKTSKFTCVICRKTFPSYQALGGHRASHKKFKGCCAPTSENSLETEKNSPNQSENQAGVFEEKIDMGVGCKRNKDHECPICFKVFPSGQALGGHKRSHLICDQAKSIDPSVSTEKPIREIRDFLDLNLPAPAEEECNDFKWWMGTSHKHQHEPLLGLLSS